VNDPILEQRAWRLGRGWPVAMSDVIPPQRPRWGRVVLKVGAVVLTLGTVGLGGGVGMAVLAFRRDSKQLGLVAVGYLAVWVIGAVALGSGQKDIGYALMLITLVVSATHLATVVAPVSVRRIRALAAREQRRKARELVASDPTRAWELGVGRPHLPHDYDDGGLIDPNEVPPGVLARIPGVTAQHAALIVAEREQRGPFATIEDLGRRDLFPSPLPPAVAEFLVIVSVGGAGQTS
jgi:DNA uptake protein ComE-like DNA-binding protein